MSVERQLMMCAGGATQQYTISNSLRFRSSASAYLNRTPSVAGNQRTWTWSAWVKLGALTGGQRLFSANESITPFTFIAYNIPDSTGSANCIQVATSGGVSQGMYTIPIYRDPSAWYHLVVAMDTTQATASDRTKVYVNGVQASLTTGTWPTLNQLTTVNSAAIHNIGRSTGGSNYFDGYLTEINFIDGQALTPSSFGETSSTTGVWIPKKYTGSYGTNGFYLNFSNNTSTTALGYDTSGNGNNWTPNNFSLTTGSTYDSMIDSPTSYASGVNNVGNYCVLNPLTYLNVAPINGNLTNSSSINSYIGAKASFGISSGKWYWEQNIDTMTSTSAAVSQASGGVSIASYNLNAGSGNAGQWGFQNSNGAGTFSWKMDNGTNTNTYTRIDAGDVVGLALNMDTGTLDVYRNNTLLFTCNNSLAGNTVFPINLVYGITATSSLNFGQRPFAYTPPSGYNALNTYNLSTPSIVDGSKQFAATIYTGTGASLSVSGANFTPDFVWIKSRSAATNHKLTDVVRGVTKALVSNSTAAETTDTNGLTAFNSNGFTVGTDTVYNNSGATYVGWQWKANGAGVTNTNGTITSTVSANQTAGFSVVTYTMPVSGTATIGHGLGVAPSFIIMKQRAGTAGWATYHESLGNTKYLLLQTPDGAATLSTVWNNTSPTTLVWTVGTAFNNLGTYVAYCFAAIPGYSAFGSYTGNGSADGAFIYTGFLPKLILVKCSSSTGNWFMLDTARNTYNVIGEQLESNLSNAGSTVTTLDVLSNGFKMRTSSDPNASQTYVYAAFAASPFKNSLAF